MAEYVSVVILTLPSRFALCGLSVLTVPDATDSRATSLSPLDAAPDRLQLDRHADRTMSRGAAFARGASGGCSRASMVGRAGDPARPTTAWASVPGPALGGP